MYFKKTISILVLLFLVVSCNSDDDKGKQVDPVFDSEYIPLKSIDELKGIYYYHGAKIGKRAFGAISASSCMASNVIFIGNEDNSSTTSHVFTFVSNKPHPQISSTCTLDFIRTVEMHEMASDGIMLVSIGFSRFLDNIGDSESENNLQELEIGMQAGYLRIEDKLSLNANKEKVYLYFKRG